MIYKILFLSLFLMFAACEKKNYSQVECEILSMKSYKGIPRSAHIFKKYCGNYKIKYTHKVCQDALTLLIDSADLTKVEAKYGAQIKYCFTENDLKKFVHSN